VSKAAREKGVRFERRIARDLRAEGLGCRRILEYDGFTHGQDLQVYEYIRPPEPGLADIRCILPVVLQCKCTKDPSDLRRGLKESFLAGPAKLYVCIHSCKRKMTILASRTGADQEEITWTQLIAAILKLSPLHPGASLSPQQAPTPPAAS
jgi:hypothetical protein